MSKDGKIKATKNGAGMALGMSMFIKQAQAFYAKGPRSELGDFHNTINAQDDHFTEEEIQKYYNKAIEDNEQDWVKEVWERISTPDLKLLSVNLNSLKAGESNDIQIDGLTPNLYTIIVYLTPDMQPEDGGTVEFWTPNLTDEIKAAAIDTPFGLQQEQEDKKDIIRAYSPKPGRVIIFDARIPHIARALTSTSKKTRISLVFKCAAVKELIKE
jgi:hypothetical protein|tara:strand:+ start:461 stop:1102 length:642 start_codon:yes stop_codon:yes gene_type:complete